MVVPHIEMVRQRYLHALLARYGTLTLPLSSQSKDIPLDAVFQPLALRSRLLSPLENESEQAEKLSENNVYQLQEQPVQAQHGAEALEKSPSRRLIILGGPGMGKTTLLKDLLQQATGK